MELDSYFIVAARAAYDYCKSGMPSIKAFYDSRRAAGIAEQDKILKRAVKRCLLMKPNGRIVIETDRKTTYPQIISQVVGSRLVHTRYNAGDDIEKKKLFPVNNAIACLRAEKAMMRRESWYVSKHKDWLNRQLSLYLFYHNYIRIKRYTRYEGDKRFFDKKTPAMHLGIFDRPISFEYVLKHA